MISLTIAVFATTAIAVQDISAPNLGSGPNRGASPDLTYSGRNGRLDVAIPRIEDPDISIDGRLDEAIWQREERPGLARGCRGSPSPEYSPTSRPTPDRRRPSYRSCLPSRRRRARATSVTGSSRCSAGPYVLPPESKPCCRDLVVQLRTARSTISGLDLPDPRPGSSESDRRLPEVHLTAEACRALEQTTSHGQRIVAADP